MLIIFGGLPGTGKTTIARKLATQIGAVHLRIDSIEQALRFSGLGVVSDEGYRVAYAIARDNLGTGRTVIADSVNPLKITRDAWRAVARSSQANSLEIEVVCSDVDEHRRRVETRITDIVGLRLPNWEQVVSREYDPWECEHLVLDTANRSVDHNVVLIRQHLAGLLRALRSASGADALGFENAAYRQEEAGEARALQRLF